MKRILQYMIVTIVCFTAVVWVPLFLLIGGIVMVRHAMFDNE